MTSPVHLMQRVSEAVEAHPGELTKNKLADEAGEGDRDTGGINPFPGTTGYCSPNPVLNRHHHPAQGRRPARPRRLSPTSTQHHLAGLYRIAEAKLLAAQQATEGGCRQCH